MLYAVELSDIFFKNLINWNNFSPTALANAKKTKKKTKKKQHTHKKERDHDEVWWHPHHVSAKEIRLHCFFCVVK